MRYTSPIGRDQYRGTSPKISTQLWMRRSDSSCCARRCWATSTKVNPDDPNYWRISLSLSLFLSLCLSLWFDEWLGIIVAKYATLEFWIAKALACRGRLSNRISLVRNVSAYSIVTNFQVVYLSRLWRLLYWMNEKFQNRMSKGASPFGEPMRSKTGAVRLP